MTPREVQQAWIDRVRVEGVAMADGSTALVLADKTVAISADGCTLSFTPHVATVVEFDAEDES